MGQWSMLEGELGVLVHTWSCLLQLLHLPRIDYWLSATQFLMPQALLSLLLPLHPRLLPASTKSCDQIALRRGGSVPLVSFLPVETRVCMSAGLRLRVFVESQGRAQWAASSPWDSRSVVHLTHGLACASHPPPSKYQVCVWAEILIPWGIYLSWIRKMADGKGRLTSPLLAGALNFLFTLDFTNCWSFLWLWTRPLKGLQPEDILGISSRILFFFSFYRLLSR